MDTIVDLQNVSKSFQKKMILDNVSLLIPPNKVTAIVGANGSGKSTLLKMIGGIIKPDSGQILYRNCPPIKIGYVPEQTPVFIPFTPTEYLIHMGTIRGLPIKWLLKRIDSLLDVFHMKDERNTRITHFSKGMKQKVIIMQAMLEESDLLILDEPLSGLDLKAQNDLEELLMSLKKRNISIVLTCHETKLLEEVADQVIVIQACRIIQTANQQEHSEPLNRLVFELPKTFSIDAFKQIITYEKEMGFERRLIELNVSQKQTNKIVSEFLDRGALIRLLEPVHKRETEFFKHF